jgi:hypothetical protein
MAVKIYSGLMLSHFLIFRIKIGFVGFGDKKVSQNMVLSAIEKNKIISAHIVPQIEISIKIFKYL